MTRKYSIDPFDTDIADDALGADFKVEQVICQLRKIVDSIGNPSPLHWVETDKGGKVWVGHKNAVKVLKLFDAATNRAAQDSTYVSNHVRPELIAAQLRVKTEITEKMQTASGLKTLIKLVSKAEWL